MRATVVAGASGFVGRAFIEFLVKRGHKNIVAVCRKAPPLTETLRDVQFVLGDLRDPAVAMEACRDADMVYNLAAQVGGIGFIGKHNVECLLSSLINTNLLLACEEHKAIRYFFASSSCVYPDGGSMRETSALPANPGTGYGWEKIFSEQMCLAFDAERRVPCSIARFHTLYGPGDIRPAGREHVIEALCKKVIAAKLSGIHEISIWGDGNQTRSFLYVDDCVEGMYKLACSGVTGPVNLSSSESATVNQLVDYIEEIAAVKLERFYNKSAPTGIQHKMTENTLLRSSLAWEPMTPLKTGLQRTYNDLWEREVCKKK
jgi:nucleoside-diphosphate-sugar epimerase